MRNYPKINNFPNFKKNTGPKLYNISVSHHSSVSHVPPHFNRISLKLPLTQMFRLRILTTGQFKNILLKYVDYYNHSAAKRKACWFWKVLVALRRKLRDKIWMRQPLHMLSKISYRTRRLGEKVACFHKDGHDNPISQII